MTAFVSVKCKVSIAVVMNCFQNTQGQHLNVLITKIIVHGIGEEIPFSVILAYQYLRKKGMLELFIHIYD